MSDSYVTFTIGGNDYGVALEDVGEVVRNCVIQSLPRLPVYGRGIMNLRGVIVAVVDAGPLLGSDGTCVGSTAVILRPTLGHGTPGRRDLDEQVALLVDDVGDIVSDVHRHGVPANVVEAVLPFVCGVIQSEGRAFTLLYAPSFIDVGKREDLQTP